MSEQTENDFAGISFAYLQYYLLLKNKQTDERDKRKNSANRP